VRGSTYGCHLSSHFLVDLLLNSLPILPDAYVSKSLEIYTLGSLHFFDIRLTLLKEF